MNERLSGYNVSFFGFEVKKSLFAIRYSLQCSHFFPMKNNNNEPNNDAVMKWK